MQAGWGRPPLKLFIPPLRPKLLLWATQSVEKPQKEKTVSRQSGLTAGLAAPSSPCSPLQAQRPLAKAKASAACLMPYCQGLLQPNLPAGRLRLHRLTPPQHYEVEAEAIQERIPRESGPAALPWRPSPCELCRWAPLGSALTKLYSEFGFMG